MTPGFYSQLEISQIIITQALRHHATPQITPGEVCVSLEQAITNTPLAWNVNTNIIITQLFHSAPQPTSLTFVLTSSPQPHITLNTSVLASFSGIYTLWDHQ